MKSRRVGCVGSPSWLPVFPAPAACRPVLILGFEPRRHVLPLPKLGAIRVLLLAVLSTAHAEEMLQRG